MYESILNEIDRSIANRLLEVDCLIEARRILLEETPTVPAPVRVKARAIVLAKSTIKALPSGQTPVAPVKQPRKWKLSPEGRARVVEASKRMWAKRKAAAALAHGRKTVQHAA